MPCCPSPSLPLLVGMRLAMATSMLDESQTHHGLLPCITKLGPLLDLVSSLYIARAVPPLSHTPEMCASCRTASHPHHTMAVVSQSSQEASLKLCCSPSEAEASSTGVD